MENALVENIYSLTNGEILDIEEVPDSVFSSKLMGDGFAIKSNDGLIYSPVDGTIGVIFPTKHAIIIKSKKKWSRNTYTFRDRNCKLRRKWI